MSDEMKASVLLTLKVDDQIGGKATASINKVEQALKTSAAEAKAAGSSIGIAAEKADALAGAAAKAGTATKEAAAAAGSIGEGYSAAVKSADALAAAANRVAAANQKAAASGKDMILYGNKAGEIAAKSNTPLMAVKGSEADKAYAIANNLERANPHMYSGPKGSALLEQHVADEMARQNGGGAGRGLGARATDLYFGAAIVGMGAHAVDGVVGLSGDLVALRDKIAMAQGGGAEGKAGAQAAYDKAMELSGKYKNTTALENLHIIDDLRANLPESLDKILKESADPFVKLHAFFKAWDGGKHSGDAHKSLQEVGAAIRSGELEGAITAEQIAQHAKAIAVGKVLFGEKFDSKQYLQGAQKDATGLSAANDEFKYVDFPVIQQRLSHGAGVALRGLFNKLVAGSTVSQASAEWFRDHDLVDMDQVKLDKKGKIDTKSIVGKKWLKGSDEYGVNMTDAIMERLVPSLKVPGLDGDKLRNAWHKGNVEQVAAILEKFREKPENVTALARELTAAAKDPKAAQGLEELILGSGAILRDRERAKGIHKEMDEGKAGPLDSYAEGKQEVGAQADRLLQAVSGDNLSGNVANAYRAIATSIGNMADAVLDAKKAYAKGGILGLFDTSETWDDIRHLRDLNRWSDGLKAEFGGGGSKATADKYGGRIQPPDPGEVPTLVGSQMAADAAPGAPGGVTIQANGPQVTFQQAPPNIAVHVTVNATTNASPDAIGSAVAGHVRSAVGGAMHDGGH